MQRAFTRHEDWIIAVAAGKLGGREVVASGSTDGTVWVWDLRKAQPVCPPLAADGGSVVALGFVQLGRWGGVVTASRGDTIQLWDPRSGVCLQSVRLPIQVMSLSCMANGQIVAGGVGGLVAVDLKGSRKGEPI